MLAPISSYGERSPVMIALHPAGRAVVTRDMELIRKILLEVQSRKTLDRRAVELDGVDAALLGRHVEMLVNAGLLEGTIRKTLASNVPEVLVTDLSWDGHDFAAALANKTVWGTFKEAFSPEQLASMPLSAMKSALIGLTTKFVEQQVGLS